MLPILYLLYSTVICMNITCILQLFNLWFLPRKVDSAALRLGLSTAIDETQNASDTRVRDSHLFLHHYLVLLPIRIAYVLGHSQRMQM